MEKILIITSVLLVLFMIAGVASAQWSSQISPPTYHYPYSTYPNYHPSYPSYYPPYGSYQYVPDYRHYFYVPGYVADVITPNGWGQVWVPGHVEYRP